MLSPGIRHGLPTERARSRLVCCHWDFWKNAPWNSLRAEELPSRRAEPAAAAPRVAAPRVSRRAEASTAPMTSQRARPVALMAARTVAAAFEPEKTISRRARACSPLLAALLARRLAELLTQLAAEVLAEHFPEHFSELRASRLGLRRTADVACDS